MYCLDTYALIEMRNGNPQYAWLSKEPFIIPELTLAEFYMVLYRENEFEQAEYWLKKLEPNTAKTPLLVLASAARFKIDNRKKNVSFFDAVGYQTSRHYKAIFVTGDKAFVDLPHVKHIK